ncbi:hypothetical protein [Anoxynatronum sibiricum]
MKRVHQLEKNSQMYLCTCGSIIGKDEGSHIKMIRTAFTYTGTKE